MYKRLFCTHLNCATFLPRLHILGDHVQAGTRGLRSGGWFNFDVIRAEHGPQAKSCGQFFIACKILV